MSNEDEIKAYMAAKMAHIKMYNECMNLADGLDVEKFAELVRADEREACAQACEDLIGTRAMARHCADEIRARGEWVKTYAGGKPNYTTPQVRTHTPEDVKKIKSKWIGLTYEERFLNDARSEEEIEYAKAIEAKLKEKNDV